MSIAATDINLSIKFPASATLNKVMSTFPVETTTHTVNVLVGELYAEERRNIPFSVKLAALSKPEQPSLVAKLILRFLYATLLQSLFQIH